MEISEKISIWLTEWIRSSSDEWSEEDLEKIKYGIHINIMNIHKVPIALLIAYLCGVFEYTLIVFIAFSLLRMNSFGIHAKTSFWCLVTTCLLLVGIALSVKLTGMQLSIYEMSLVFCTVFISVFLFAPADTEERPILKKESRRQMRKRSINVVFLLYFVALYLYSKNMMTYATLITMAALLQGILISPLTYKLAGQQFDNYLYYKG